MSMDTPPDLTFTPSQTLDPQTLMTEKVNTDLFSDRTQLKELRVAHRDLDVAINELQKNPDADQLRVRRLKKQKLRLKDLINRLESSLIPDLNA